MPVANVFQGASYHLDEAKLDLIQRGVDAKCAELGRGAIDDDAVVDALVNIDWEEGPVHQDYLDKAPVEAIVNWLVDILDDVDE